jgi:hypothetical protein
MPKLCLLGSILLLLASSPLFAIDAKEVSAAKQTFAQAAGKDPEAARTAYVIKLAGMFEKSLNAYHKTGNRDTSPELQEVISELVKHPMPKGADGKALSKRLVGDWNSTRRGYRFKSDGTWAVIGEETKGTWKIAGNRFNQDFDGGSTDKHINTIVLLNDRYFIYASEGSVFFHSRR